MSAFLSPVFGAGAQLFTDQGVVLAGGHIYSYVAGSTTPVATYTDTTQSTPNSNPIVLDSAGRPPQEIWIAGGTAVKFIVTDSVGALVGSAYDNVTGVNDPATTNQLTPWVATNLTPTYSSGTTFTVPGNQVSVFPIGTRLQTQNTAGVVYSTVVNSVFSSVTTVTVVNDSTVLDSGLSSVAVSLLSPAAPPIDANAVSWTSSISGQQGSLARGMISVGTWTPALAFGGSSTGITYSATPVGVWSLTANQFMFTITMVLTSKGSQTGAATVTMPSGYILASNFSGVFPVSALGMTGLTGMLMALGPSAGLLNFRQSAGAGLPTNLTDTVFTNGSSLTISGCFVTSNVQ